MEARKKVIIDTDIGDDLDDAVALFCAMAEGMDILGITTVFRNTQARANMAKQLLKDFGHGYENIPVYAGFSSYAEEAPENQEHMGLFSSEEIDDTTDPQAAIDFIIDSCHHYGKDLTVIAIGPFCNIAKVIEQDPTALHLANKVVIMGGAYFKQYADWNVMCDVPAADRMFRNLNNLECIGADVTHQLTTDTAVIDALEDGSKGYLSQLYRLWRKNYPTQKLVLHDVLAVYYALDASICTTQPIRVAVLAEGFAKGMTLNVDSYSKASLNRHYENFDFSHTVQAASNVDIAKFNQFLLRDVVI